VDITLSPPRPNAVQADLGLGVVGLAYERTFASWVAVQFEAQVFGTWFGPAVDKPFFRGFGGQLRPTFFLTGAAPSGVYVAPFVRVDRVRAEENGATGTTVGYSAGAWLGYAFVVGERANLRFGAGAQYMDYVADAQGRKLAFDMVFPAIDVVIGYAF
jgi:hypothetical protein